MKFQLIKSLVRLESRKGGEEKKNLGNQFLPITVPLKNKELFLKFSQYGLITGINPNKPRKKILIASISIKVTLILIAKLFYVKTKSIY